MEIKQLEYFLAVSEHGSFSKAAVLLSVAQPVLSRHVRTLEEELGTELFYRNGRGVETTEAGKMLLGHAQAILASAGQIAGEIESLCASPRGRLALGIPPTASSILTLPLVRRIRSTFPRVKLKIQEGYSGHVLEWLSTGRIDVAILYNAPKTSTLLTQPLIEEELYLIGPGDSPEARWDGPISGERLARLPLILPSNPHGLRRLVDSALATIDVEPNVECEIDSFGSSLELVEQGEGYTILPYASVRRQVRAGRLSATSIVEPRVTRQLVLATSMQRPMTAVTRTLARTVADLVRELMSGGVWMPERKPPAELLGRLPEAGCPGLPQQASRVPDSAVQKAEIG